MRSGLNEVLLLALLCVALRCAVVEGKKNTLSSEREMEVERRLKLLNKPAVKSLQSEDGDIIDCVDIYKQPAFDHPLLRNHTIQMRPKHDPSDSKDVASSAHPSPSSLSSLVSSQTWQKSGSCPVGTVPIRRVQKHHLLNPPSLKNYGRKVSLGVKEYDIHASNHTFAVGIEALHTSATLVTGGFSYIGAKANINVWNPSVEYNNESSSGLIRLRRGPYNDSDLIEAGWTVNPAVYGDTRTRFYTYWTDDSGKNTGCFDLLCSGFVQTNNEIALGAPIEPVSSRFGGQYHITLYVFKDYEKDGSWWLVWGENTTVGYWPTSLFQYLNDAASVLEWGGDVYSPRLHSKPHTATEMGSGRLAWERWGSAAFIQEPRMRDYSLMLKYPDPSFVFTPQADCYSGENFAVKPFTEPLFYWGGPGRSDFCP